MLHSIIVRSTLLSWVTLVLLLIPIRYTQAETLPPLTLNFGIYTAVKPSSMVKKFRPITKAISKLMTIELKRPVKVRFRVSPSYEAAIDNIVTGEVDFSRFGPASYIAALKSNKRLNTLAVETRNGSIYSKGIICVASHSEINSIKDLKGKSFAFGSEMSTIGRYLSQQYLLKKGVKAKDLEYFEYLGRHDAVGAAVGSGLFDAGALKEQTFKKLKAKGTAIRELASFTNAPQAWIAREFLDKAVFSALQNALFLIKNKKVLSGIGADSFVKPSAVYFSGVKRAINNNKAFFK